MTLRTLVESLRALPADQLKNLNTALVRNRITYPERWGNFTTALYPTSKGGKNTPHLHLSAFPNNESLPEIPILLAWLLQEIRKTDFQPKTFHLNAAVRWSPESFAYECSLGRLSGFRIQSRFYTHDVITNRFQFSSKKHAVEAALEKDALEIAVSGDYRTLVPRIIQELRPQRATIKVSESDAERWIANTGFLRKWWLRCDLEPQKNHGFRITAGDGVQRTTKEERKVTIATSSLPACAQAIGKPLIGDMTDKETYVIGLRKTFLWESDILTTLKKLVKIINELKTEAVFNQPLLSRLQAQEMLRQEIDALAKSYEEPLLLGMNTHMIRSPFVKRLAKEYFGNDILVPLETMDTSEYLLFLQKMGFHYNPEERRHHPPYIEKEIYLLRFLRESYAKDPRTLIDEMQRSYVNLLPKMSITGGIEIDAARICRTPLPNRATISGISLEERFPERSNLLSLTRLDESAMQLGIEVSLGSPKLLHIQEGLCERVGIVCK